MTSTNRLLRMWSVQFVSLLLVIGFTLPSVAVDTIGDLNPANNPNLVVGIPQNLRQLPEVQISRNEYYLSWNPQNRIINWVAWKLSSRDIGSVQRQRYFNLDFELNAYLNSTFNQGAVGPNDYSQSCFDKGHQVPSGDRTSELTANQATFLMSNIIPQTAFLNRGIWEHLERYERSLVESGRTILIFAGVIYDHKPGYIGPSYNIAVPTHNFKIIYDATNAGPARRLTPLVSVIMPNQTSRGTDPLNDRQTLCNEFNNNDNKAVDLEDWKKYSVSTHEIMQRSGFDFDNLVQWQSSRKK